MLPIEGFLAQHMAMHIVAMGLVAPLIVLTWRSATASRLVPLPNALAPATALQIGLLWGWHIPAVLADALHNPAAMAVMHGSLFLSALWFWHAVIAEAERAGWKALAALLVMGKLFCLLGVLLTFAPRPIYWQTVLSSVHFDTASRQLLGDQQLAGLVMLTACPVVYVGAAIIVATRWLKTIARLDAWDIGQGGP